ncbi:MAG: hypothetical protein OEV00_14875, partial [Acidobacteriota bacterium]|nr:hypothetical protein [Acidobacteriota bacterium]
MGRSWLASGIGIALMFSVACSGGSGGSGVVGGGPSGSTNLVMNFQAAQPSPGPLSVAMSEVSGPADDQVVVRVSVTDTTDVFGAGFDVLFDASQVRFVQWTAG